MKISVYTFYIGNIVEIKRKNLTILFHILEDLNFKWQASQQLSNKKEFLRTIDFNNAINVYLETHTVTRDVNSNCDFDITKHSYSELIKYIKERAI